MCSLMIDKLWGTYFDTYQAVVGGSFWRKFWLGFGWIDKTIDRVFLGSGEESGECFQKPMPMEVVRHIRVGFRALAQNRQLPIIPVEFLIADYYLWAAVAAEKGALINSEAFGLTPLTLFGYATKFVVSHLPNGCG